MVFAYSDQAHEEVIQGLGERSGADFMLMGAKTMVKTTKPHITVCAVRTAVAIPDHAHDHQSPKSERTRRFDPPPHALWRLVKQKAQRLPS